MGQGYLGMNPFYAILFEGKSTEECRCQTEWMDGRTHIVGKTGQSEFIRTTATANLLFGLKNEHSMALAGESDARREAIGARANNNRVIGRFANHGTFFHWIMVIRHSHHYLTFGRNQRTGVVTL